MSRRGLLLVMRPVASLLALVVPQSPSFADDRLGGDFTPAIYECFADDQYFFLRLGSDLSYEQIAAATGVPIGTVRSRIHRGRRMLRTALLADGVTGP